VIYKIADDYQSIANAARRFLDQEEQMDVKVHNVFAGHLRAIVGTMTVEGLIRNQDTLTRVTRESAASEMQRLGLTIDSLQIQEIVDNTGYIENVSMPEAARVAKEARIAQSQADREATEQEQASEALKAAAAQRVADPPGGGDGRSAAGSGHGRAGRSARGGDGEAGGGRPGDEGGREARQARGGGDRNADAAGRRGAGRCHDRQGTAEGEAVKARGLAEAEAIKARAAALAQNQDAVIAQQIAERLPLIVAEAAKAFSGIGQFTVLNGAEGVGEAFAQVLGMGATAIPLLRNALRQNGTATGQSTPPKAEQTKRTK